MASAKLFDMQGAEVGTVDLNDAVFSAAPNEGLVHEVVVAIQAAKRQGTAATKTRKHVRGGGRKPFRQKGTGHARQGSIREPKMRGGGVVFGPHPRDYRKKVPVRVKRRALCCVLSDRLRSERLCVLNALDVPEAKTKPFAAMVERFSPDGKNTLFVTAKRDEKVLLSSRNIPRVVIQTAADLNALDALYAHRIVVAQDALAELEARLT